MLPLLLVYVVSVKMVASSKLNFLLSSIGLVGVGLCQKEQIADARSKLIMPPKLGIGTWFMDISVENTTEAIANAIVEGYRHIDGMNWPYIS